MSAKGKWAQGITPRHFKWVLKGRLAISERPGGYGENHRKVRRQEEIIWIREQGFSKVVSLSRAPHNLHNYDEVGLNWLHRPYPPRELLGDFLPVMYAEIERELANDGCLLLHGESVNDELTGLVAGYVVWCNVLDDTPKATALVEQLVGRQLETVGRETVLLAHKLSPYRE